MKYSLKRFISKQVLQYQKKTIGEKPVYTPYELAKAFRELKISTRNFFRDVLFILLGIGSATFGLKGFLLPNDFIDGGATGIALLFHELTYPPFALMLILVNIPFMLLGYNTIGKAFTIRAALAIAGLAIAAAIFNDNPVTNDKLLVAVFGGFFLGAGIGFTIRGGAVIDGTEVLALYLSRKFSTTVGDVITVINVIIFGAAAYLLSVDIALYAMVTYLAASKTVDFIIEGIEEYTGVTIVSSHSEEIKEMIIEKLGRGITLYKANAGYGKHGHAEEKNVIYTVITRLEISKLNSELQKIDPNAFVVMTPIKDIKGGMIKKRRLKH